LGLDDASVSSDLMSTERGSSLKSSLSDEKGRLAKIEPTLAIVGCFSGVQSKAPQRDLWLSMNRYEGGDEDRALVFLPSSVMALSTQI
jgi:hypothetical protein